MSTEKEGEKGDKVMPRAVPAELVNFQGIPAHICRAFFSLHWTVQYNTLDIILFGFRARPSHGHGQPSLG